MVTRDELLRLLGGVKACSPSIDFIATVPGDHAQIMAVCYQHHPTWALWWARNAGVSGEKLAACAKELALLVTTEEQIANTVHPEPGESDYHKKLAAVYARHAVAVSRHAEDVATCVLECSPSNKEAVSEIVSRRVSVQIIEDAITSKGVR